MTQVNDIPEIGDVLVRSAALDWNADLREKNGQAGLQPRAFRNAGCLIIH